MTNNIPPYETGAQLLNCEQVKTGYEKPSYSMIPTMNGIVPSCDNRSYSAYATHSAYQGYYDNCFIDTTNTKPQCDLKYVNAPPKVDIQCWEKCCSSDPDPNTRTKSDRCTDDCHVKCVVANQFPVSPPKK